MVKNSTRSFFKDDIFQLSVIISLMANLAMWGILAWRVHPTEDPIALQYNIYFGISRIGYWYQVFFLPATGAAIFLVNLFLAYGLSFKERLASQLLISGAALSQLILLFSVHLITTFI